MPKLLLATPNRFYYSETFVRDHIAWLKPAIVLFGGWRPFETEENHTVFKGPFKINLLRGLTKRLLPGYYSRLYSRSLAAFLISNKVDIILAEYGVTAANMLEGAKLAKVPLTCIFHGFDAYEYKTLKEYQVKYTELFAYAKVIITVSEDMKHELHRHGCDYSKMVVIPCGVNPERFTSSAIKGGEKLFFVGRFTPKKDPMGLIKTFEKITVKFPSASLTMAGEGELWDECQKYIQDKGLSAIHLTGKVDYPALYALYENASIYVQHSIRVPSSGDSEGTPVSILEASCMGLPIVSTYHAGIKEAVIHNKTGYLSEESDYDSFEGYICTLLANPELQQEFGGNARSHVISNYNQPDLIEKIKKVLETCQSAQ